MKHLTTLITFVISSQLLSFNPDHLDKLIQIKVCQNCDLNDISLVDMDLGKIDVRGSRLNNAHLVDCNLKGSNFDEVTADGINLSGSSLEQTSFRNSSFKNSVFIKSTLYQSSFENSNLTGSHFRLEKEGNGEISFDRAILNKASFSHSFLVNSSFVKAQARNCWFYNSALRRIKAMNSVFIDCSFKYADISRGTFAGANLSKSYFIENIAKKMQFSGADFTNAIIRHKSDKPEVDYSFTIDHLLRVAIIKDTEYNNAVYNSSK